MSYKGSSWKKHKYVKKFNNRYYYSLDDYIQEHKDELDRDLEKDVTKSTRTIKRSTKKLDNYIESAPDRILNIKIPKMDLKKIKMTPEMKKHGKEKFNEALIAFKEIDYAISDKLIEGVKSFNKLLAKIF